MYLTCTFIYLSRDLTCGELLVPLQTNHRIDDKRKRIYSAHEIFRNIFTRFIMWYTAEPLK